MRLTIQELDQFYGNEVLEVYRYAPRGLYTDRPRLLSYLRDRTCPECHLRISNAPRDVLVRRRYYSGKVEFVTQRIPSSGFYLYFRTRGLGTPFFREVRFVHNYCIVKRTAARDDQSRFGWEWVPQVRETRLIDGMNKSVDHDLGTNE